MSTRPSFDHLSAERMQAFLDGDLTREDAASVKAHVDGCPRCRSELDAWEALFDELGELPVLAPSASFRARILESAPVAGDGRARKRRAAGSASVVGDHVPSGRLQDHLEGRLAARVSTRIDEHLDTCAVCRSELAALRRVSLALDELGHLAPTPDFGERVMATWRVEQLTRVAMAPTTRWGRVAAWARAHAPSSRQGWAAALGVATAPAVVAVLIIQAVFSSPLVTVGNLVAFFRLKMADGMGALLAQVGSLVQAAGLEPAARAALDALQSPPVAAGAATMASGLLFAALWVVYRFLIASQPADRPYAHSR